MKLMTYENLERFIKGAVEFIPGLTLVIRHIETTNPDKPSVRIEYSPTNFCTDENLRKLSKTAKRYFLEISLETFEEGEKYFNLLNHAILDILTKGSSAEDIISGDPVNQNENIKTISEEDYATFREKYNNSVENFSGSSVDTFPLIVVNPHSGLDMKLKVHK